MANALTDWLAQSANRAGANYDALKSLGIDPYGQNGSQWSFTPMGGDSGGASGYSLSPEAMQMLQGYTVSDPRTTADNIYSTVYDPNGQSMGDVSVPVSKDSWLDKIGYSGALIALPALAAAGGFIPGVDGLFGGAAAGGGADAALSGAATEGGFAGSALGSMPQATSFAAELGGSAIPAGLSEAAISALPGAAGGAGGASGIGGLAGTMIGDAPMASTFGGLGGATVPAAAASLIPGISNSTLLSGAVSGLNGLLGYNAAQNAADAQLAAGRESNALAKYMYDTTRSDYAPYRQAGTDALAQIQGLLKDPSAITKQADYQFGLNQGTRALDNSAASRGGLYSGAQLKASQKFGQDYAGTKLDQSYNRLASIAGIGQQATGSTSAAGQNYANNVGNTMQNMGNVQGSAYVGGANALTGALGGFMNNWQQQQLLDLLKKGP